MHRRNQKYQGESIPAAVSSSYEDENIAESRIGYFLHNKLKLAVTRDTAFRIQRYMVNEFKIIIRTNIN